MRRFTLITTLGLELTTDAGGIAGIELLFEIIAKPGEQIASITEEADADSVPTFALAA